ncbi:amino acid ABC transporter permease [Gallibacterium anatis]|uniref:Amino acid ABC transporter permease n=1 Tax=Gallibacterium anatis TaxID=750 RepID=A0A1A7P5X5_9PAST|nr:amino acid ABC transporter permease [Gallibacterium anatis]KGQ54320.1 amino acid ABC transporter permease [Gallibacterium anatis DSM 16844 = F 149]OBW95055.1 amino acid ABC transporter permease [Gallibacterium anatis]OBW97852.1 amino acid ABC transporter permease [Gallibacterium anatis]STO38370.1 Glutamine transport system permease protein glnP [Gallibacterium anatis]
MGFDGLFSLTNLWRLLEGLGLTIYISFVAIFFSAIFGTLMGIAMTSKNRLIRYFCQIYLEIVRVTPLLALLFVSYFGLAKWFNLHLNSELVCIIVFIFWGTAEMGDLVRGAITSIDRHQSESALALGLSKAQTFRYILLPLSVKCALPSVINLFTRMVKTSSLAMLIGTLEVIKVGQQIIETSLFAMPTASFWIYGLIMLMYFVICYPLSWFAGRLEKKN